MPIIASTRCVRIVAHMTITVILVDRAVLTLLSCPVLALTNRPHDLMIGNTVALLFGVSDYLLTVHYTTFLRAFGKKEKNAVHTVTQSRNTEEDLLQTKSLPKCTQIAGNHGWSIIDFESYNSFLATHDLVILKQEKREHAQ